MENILLWAAIALTSVTLVTVIITYKSISSRLASIESGSRKKEDDSAGIAARQEVLITTVDSSLNGLKNDMANTAMQTDQRLEFLRRSIETSMTQLREENTRQLDNIRRTVDEKLQDTLEKKLNQSFSQVSSLLEQVYKGLGEMQTLASGVGDLKRVLSNVKTRGVLGEIQLGAILEQILSPEQYDTNVAVKPGSQANVEYAIRLPGSDEGTVWLPIDSKFPLDCYEKLVNAYDSGDPASVEAATKELKDRIRRFAKDIHEKYISPPDTTDFAIMFLPSEGLYAEAVRIGMIELLQREFKVSIAGPTTMGALLNSLQMGFRTLAIQKRSSEVWRVLSAVKKEFDNFATVLEATQKRLQQADDDLEKLIGVRTRKIQSTLSKVQAFSEDSEEDTPALMEDYINV